MTPTIAGLYLLTILAPGIKLELVSKPGLTAERCKAAGEEWVARGRGYRYECKPVKSIQTIKR